MKCRLVVIMFVLTLGTAIFSHADRIPPAPAAPVEYNNLIYKAPTDIPESGYNTVGFVNAYDSKTNRRIWSRQIYVVKHDIDMESDVQDVYITNLVLTNNQLHIHTERGYEYELDLATLEVKPIKGKLLITE